MLLFRNNVARRLIPGVCLLMLTIVLAACSGLSGITGGSPTPTPTPSPRPSPTASAATQTYKGNGYTIAYPQGWKVQPSGNQVVFQDAQGLNVMTIVIVPNPGGLNSADNIADTTFPLVEKTLLTNPQPATNVLSTTTVAGDTWSQRGATGTLASGAPVQGELIMLVDNHPLNSPNTQTYEIYYGGPSLTFAQVNATYFQAMLQSFKFTA